MNGVSSGHWPNPHEQFECECTHFLEQISNVLTFSPAVSSSVLNYSIISVKNTSCEPLAGKQVRDLRHVCFQKSTWFGEAVQQISIKLQWPGQLLSYGLAALDPHGHWELWEAGVGIL